MTCGICGVKLLESKPSHKLEGMEICSDCHAEETGAAERTQEPKNKVGEALRAVGIVTIILGVITALMFLSNASDQPYGQQTVYRVQAGGIFISTFISGMTFVGFSEVIQLLSDIKDNN